MHLIARAGETGVDPAEPQADSGHLPAGLATDASPGAPPPEDDEGGGGDRPWWQSPWRLAVLALALVFLGGAGGYAIANRSDAPPGAHSVDVGFLQDMRWHHDQATQMALTYLGKPAADEDRALRTIAAEILLEQQLEAGVMAERLHSYGQPEQNESGTGMAWMGMPVPVDKMPGMASADQLNHLRTATGKDADRLFATLMIAHHQGGVSMAEDAAARASEGRVKELAENMASGQREEITELQGILARLG